MISEGQKNDIPYAIPLLKQININGSKILADRGYNSNKVLKYVHANGAKATIPSKRNAKIQRSCDWWLYKERHLVEKLFLKLKAYRRIATRYDKDAFGEAPDNASKVDDENVVTYYSKNDADSDSAKYAAKGGWISDKATDEKLVPVETSNQWILLDVYKGRITMEQFIAGLSVDQMSWIVNGVDVGTESTAGRSELGTFEYRDEDTYKYTDANGNETRSGGNTLGWAALYTSGTVWASTPNYYNTLLIPSTDLSDGLPEHVSQRPARRHCGSWFLRSR